MHYTTTGPALDGSPNVRQVWSKMAFKNDFVDLLTKYGRLPIKTVKQGLDLCAENEQLREKQKKHEQEIEEVKTVHAKTTEGNLLKIINEEQKSELKLQIEANQMKDQVIQEQKLVS